MGRIRARRASLLAVVSRCAAVALCVALTSCSGANSSLSTEDLARAAIQHRLDGIWRLSSYVPERSLSPALMLAMKLEVIALRFEAGRIRSQSALLSFDRGYRIDNAAENTFKLYVTDDVGVEYENHCEFDRTGNLLMFRTITPPWRGQGILER